MGQFQSTRARFGKDKTMRPHVNMSTLVRSCDCNWSMRFLWGPGFKQKIDLSAKTPLNAYGEFAGSYWGWALGQVRFVEGLAIAGSRSMGSQHKV